MRIIYFGKKIISFTVIFCMVILSATSSATRSDQKIEVKFLGGISYLAGTDFDASDRGWDFLRKETMENQGGIYAWEQNSLDWGREIAGEILFNLSPRLALSGGVGYITGKSHSKGTTSLEGITTINETDLKANAIPVTVGIYYYLPVSSSSQFFLNGGVDYYFASFSRNYVSEDVGIYWVNSDFTGNASEIGFHGGIGFEHDLSKNVAIVIQGFGRYAKISGFEGTRKRVDSNDWGDSWEGKYYYSDRQHSSEKLLPRVNQTDPSTIENAINIRDYESDFSGFTIRIGLKIALF
ncbi:MAG: outer membrane beta-barrel protein [Candidatus Aminicenantes bacterium]|nr:MAG: outer membrane beta-barrel protein [Candidatus Aminicenantes bacterium]